MAEKLQLLWISYSSANSSGQLFEECKRLCNAVRCLPSMALKVLSRSRADAVIFNFDDPAAAQLQWLQSVKRQHPGVPILMITETHSEDLAVWALRARVWNYLVSPVPLRELEVNLQQLAKLVQLREPGGRQMQRPGAMLPAPHAPPALRSEEAAMQKIIEHIRRSHTTRLRIAQLARTCYMSRYSFSRLFLRNFGCSCREYVMRLRIETACKLLQTPNASVTSVAAATGFTDASYFARIFRQRLGKSPKEYALITATDRRRKPNALSSRSR